MIYFDNSATSFPKPEIVYKKMMDLYQRFGVNPHRGNYKLSFEAGNIVEETRTLISNFFNGYGRDFVVFTFNATDSLNMAIKGLLEDGDEVITTVLEHNSVLRPLNHLKNEKNIKVTYLNIKDEEISLEELRQNLSKKTKLVIVNHISNVTGYIQDIKAIGEIIKKNSRAFFLVDASQSAGIVPIDQKDSKIDILITTGHKALYAPTGIGLLLLAPEVKIKPLRTGGSGHNSENPYQPENMPDYLEAGTLNIIGIFGLKAGIEFLIDTGIENIHKKELLLKSFLLEELRSSNFNIFTSKKDSAGIISLNSNKYSPIELATILDEAGIATRSGLHCAPLLHKSIGTFPEGTLRISFGFFNTEDEVVFLSNILKNI
ncbi:MAG: aminotransferase class V-fold PLP-dependent enzyme [Brevinematales bacterium]|nr:aminotransferase class V-fold PLP-dependent enzyme [Brevinematales bacterium]